MEIKDMKKGMCSLKLENMSKVYNKKGEVDPTLIRAKFSILDFSASGNRQVISKQVGIDCMNTLKFKPLVCEYIEATDYDTPNDDFGDHDEKIIKLRNGEEYIGSGTTPIGVCEEVYMGVTTNEDGEEIDCIVGEFLLWLYRYPNEISLINEFYEKEETLYTSCEHYYKSTSRDTDGNEIIDSFILDGHCLLGREVEPAYTSSKLIGFNESWNKAINSKRQNNKKGSEGIEMKNIMFEHLKSTNAISASEYQWKLYDALSEVMIAKDYENLWLSNYSIYPKEGYFIAEIYDDGYKQYKITFTVDAEDKVSVDYEGKTEVEYQLAPVTELQSSLNAKDVKIGELEAEIETVKTSLNTVTLDLETTKESLNTKITEVGVVTSEKTDLSTKLNDTNEMVISLNTKVAELNSEIDIMKPIVEAHQEQEYQKVLNSVTEVYKEKFEKVGANEVFELEETQELIKKSINSIDLSEVNEFKFKLNQLVIDNITTKINQEEKPLAKSVNNIIKSKENKDLLDGVIDEFEDKYGFKK